MSYVQNVILSFSYAENDVKARLDEVNALLERLDQNPFVIPPDDKWYGGSKHLERHTYVAAFNYLRIDEFLAGVAAIKWDGPDDVQVHICDEEDEHYHLRLGRDGHLIRVEALRVIEDALRAAQITLSRARHYEHPGEQMADAKTYHKICEALGALDEGRR